MEKSTTLIIQIIGCVALGCMLGMAFWLCDGGKQRTALSDRVNIITSATIQRHFAREGGILTEYIISGGNGGSGSKDSDETIKIYNGR